MRRCRPLLGTFVEIDGPDEVAIAAGFAAVERVHRLMSAHDPDSEIGALNRSNGARVPLSAGTRFVLDRAQYWARRSGGCFDIVVAGGEALRRGALPRHAGQVVPEAGLDHRALRLDDGGGSLEPGACVDLGGIAKGFAVDSAVEAMRAAGAAAGLVNAGGDLFVFGEPRTVDIVDPRERSPRLAISVCDYAVATSAGIAREGAALDFAHLGGPRGDKISVTVVAPSALDADALTKIAWRDHERLGELLSLCDARAIVLGPESTSFISVDLAVAA